MVKKKTWCSPSLTSLDSNHLGPPMFCFPMHLHIWLPLGIKIWHRKIFGLKLFIRKPGRRMYGMCLCVWRMIGDKIFLCNQGPEFLGMRTVNCWIGRSVLMRRLGDESCKSYARIPGSPALPSSLLLSVGHVFAIRLWGSWSVVVQCCRRSTDVGAQ